VAKLAGDARSDADRESSGWLEKDVLTEAIEPGVSKVMLRDSGFV
jgi:hypothetical protein